MNFFDPLPTRKLLSLQHLSSKTHRHLKNTYGTLLVLCAIAAAGAATNIYFGLSSLTVLLSFVFILMFSFSSDYEYRKLALYGFSFCQGSMIGPLINYTMHLNKMIPFVAFGGTTIIFACFSLFALISKRREYLYLGGVCSSILFLFLWMNLFNLFFRSHTLYILELYGGLVLFCGYLVYDTQCIIERAENGILDPLEDSLRLFTDAISLFVRILRILERNAEKKKRNARRS